MIIHVIEDDPGVSDSLMVLLHNNSFTVKAYPSAEAFFRENPPEPGDAVLVDLRLPGIDGASVIRWLQRLEKPPRILVISGQTQAEIESQLRGIKVAHVLRKPLSGDVLTKHLGA